MENKILAHSLAVLFLCCSILSFGAAKSVGDDLPPIDQSAAYKDLLSKPKTNFSKGLCVLSYFRDLPLSVQYDGVDYPVLVAYPIGLAYFLANYHDENPSVWIKRNCYRSFQKNNIIYFKFPDGRFRPARDVLIEKLNELEKALKQKA